MFFKNWNKSNISYVKELFTDNGFRSRDEIGKVYKKANLFVNIR